MALIGKEIVVRLKSPDIIFLPIYLITSLEILLKVFTKFVSWHFLPPDSYASQTRGSPYCFLLIFKGLYA